MRPVLKPALRQCWRTPTTLQLGLDERRALVLTELALPDVALLQHLDGLLTVQDVLARTPVGERRRAADLITRLADAGALDDGCLPVGTADAGERATVSLLHPRPGDADSVLAHRASASVRVEGSGPLALALTDLLGVCGLPPAGEGRPSLLVLAADGPGAPVGPARRATASGQHQLLVRIEETRAVLGPYVVPGSSACTDCLSLTRAARDPAAPLAEATARLPREQDARSPVLVGLAAALAARQVLRAVDGLPPELLGATLETDLVDGLLRRRTWSQHPACACAG